MKQYFAEEKLKDVDGEEGWYRLVFSAHDEESAQEWVEMYQNFFNTKVKYGGELT
jgi:hypothetical protein